MVWPRTQMQPFLTGMHLPSEQLWVVLGHFQIILSAIDKGSGRYIQHGIKRDCRKRVTLNYCHKVNNRHKGRDKIFLGFVHSC